MDKSAAAAAVLAVLAATLLTQRLRDFSPDGGMLLVEEQAGAELGKDVVKIRSEEDAAGRRSARRGRCSPSRSRAEAAVQIALLNNRGLQAAYNELGISEAEMVEASLPPSA